LLVPGLPAGAQREASESDVKAAFLYNFTKFVDWPPAAFASGDSPFRLCVFGQDPFGRGLDDLVRGETVNSRRLVVERPDRIQDLRSCHLLFVSRSERARTEEILDSLRGTSVLTVGESDGFLDKGGLINFVRSGTKIRFEIRERPATPEAPKISSKLMRLAVNSPGAR
jgi:hypothetical protein